MNAKRKHQQGLRPKSGNLRRTRGRQEFFDLARNVYVPDEFMAERDDTRRNSGCLMNARFHEAYRSSKGARLWGSRLK